MKYNSTSSFRRKLLESYEEGINMSLTRNTRSSQSSSESADSLTTSSCVSGQKRRNKKWNKFIADESDGDMKYEEKPSTPLDILFPDDLEKLQTEMQTLKKENVSLSKALHTSEEKCELLKIEIDTSAKFRNPMTGAQLATSKIVELSKKIRELTADLGASKLQCKQLENVVKRFSAIHDANATAGTSGIGTATTLQSCGDSTSASLSEEQKKLKKQMEALQLKLFRSRSDNEKLKSQIDIAHKVIEREVGKEADAVLQELQDGDWKGRAEQVVEMKGKIAELTEKLETRQSCFMVNRNKVDAMKAKEKEMKSEHQKEIQELKSQVEEYRKSNVGAKARYRVLECELKDERNKIKILTEKSRTDEEIIEILKKKVKTNTDEKAKEQELKKDLEKQLAYLQEELAQMKTQCNHLMSALKERETRINLQEEKIAFLNLALNRLDSPIVANEKFEQEKLLTVEDRDKLYDSLEVDRNTNKIEKDISKDVTFTEETSIPVEKDSECSKQDKRNAPQIQMKSKLPTSRQSKY